MVHDNRDRAGKTVAPLLAVALVVVIANVGMNAVALHVEVPDLPDLPDLPDIPGWIRFILGKGKLIVIAIFLVLAVVGQETTRRRGNDHDGA
jgi:hypothetical protein